MTETRTIQITEVDKDERTFTGLFAPYNEVIEHNGGKERYEAGLFADAEPVEIYFNHGKARLGGDMPIAEVLSYTDSETGNALTARFYDTTRGEEAYALTKAGKLNSLSAGFIALEERDEDGVRVLQKAYLDEVSLVKKPAYPSAKISEVRSEEQIKTKETVSTDTTNNMTEVREYDDTELRSGLENLERRFEVLSNKEEVTAAPQYRSGGEWLKSLAAGSEDAKAEAVREVRAAYTGTVANAHAYPDWKNDLLVIINRGRPVVNAFDHAPLGPSGMSVEYPRVSGVTGDVAVQTNEADVVSTIKVATTTATAPIRTYAAFSELSRQAIERTDISYLDATLRAQAASYAKVTNDAVRAALVAATPQTGTSFTLSSATAANFVGAVTDAVQKIDVNGYYGRTADFVLVGWDVWQKLVNLFDGNGRPLFGINNDGHNTVGNVNVPAAGASIAGLPVLVDAGAAAKTLYVCNSQAVTTWENPGAPLRLEDENITNLTKQFSIYGYVAVGVKDANGLVKATIA